MCDRHQHQGPDQERDLANDLRNTETKNTLDQARIRSEPGRELAYSPVGEKSGRLIDQAAEEVPSQISHHPLRYRRGQITLDEVDHRQHGEQEKQPDRDAVEERGIFSQEGGVEEFPDDQRKRQTDTHAAEHQDTSQEKRCPVRPYAGAQPAEEPEGPLGGQALSVRHGNAMLCNRSITRWVTYRRKG